VFYRAAMYRLANRLIVVLCYRRLLR